MVRQGAQLSWHNPRLEVVVRPEYWSEWANRSAAVLCCGDGRALDVAVLARMGWDKGSWARCIRMGMCRSNRVCVSVGLQG